MRDDWDARRSSFLAACSAKQAHFTVIRGHPWRSVEMWLIKTKCFIKSRSKESSKINSLQFPEIHILISILLKQPTIWWRCFALWEDICDVFLLRSSISVRALCTNSRQTVQELGNLHVSLSILLFLNNIMIYLLWQLHCRTAVLKDGPSVLYLYLTFFLCCFSFKVPCFHTVHI